MRGYSFSAPGAQRPNSRGPQRTAGFSIPQRTAGFSIPQRTAGFSIPQRTAGFSIIELMVAVVLALIVSGAVISVFVGSRSAYQATSGVAAVADGGRVALDFIEESARTAGFMECNHATTNTSLTILNTIASNLAYDFSHGVGGYEAAATGPTDNLAISATPAADGSVNDWNPNLDPAFNAGVNQQIQGSDVLVLRSSVQRFTPAYTSGDIAVGATTLTVADPGQLTGGQLATVSDCTKSVTFQIGSVTAGTPGTLNLAGAGMPGNAAAALPIAFSSGALVSPVSTVVYYVGVGADGDGALKRMEEVNGTVNGAQIFTDEELVPDVENMQVLYGVDTTGTQTASAYVTADQVTDFNSVVSIKVAVLSASAAATVPPPAVAPPPFDLLGTLVTAPRDSRSRKVFDVTITLRNAVP
jgi:type IV pilus assembly protein PilW